MPRFQKWTGILSDYVGYILVNYKPQSLTALMQSIEADIRTTDKPSSLTIKIWKSGQTK